MGYEDTLLKLDTEDHREELTRNIKIIGRKIESIEQLLETSQTEQLVQILGGMTYELTGGANSLISTNAIDFSTDEIYAVSIDQWERSIIQVFDQLDRFKQALNSLKTFGVSVTNPDDLTQVKLKEKQHVLLTKTEMVALDSLHSFDLIALRERLRSTELAKKIHIFEIDELELNLIKRIYYRES